MLSGNKHLYKFWYANNDRILYQFNLKEFYD